MIKVISGQKSNDTNIVLIPEGKETAYDSYLHEYSFDSSKNQVLHVRLPDGKKLIFVGLAKKNNYMNQIANAVRMANRAKSKEVSIDPENVTETVIAAFLASYKYSRKTDDDKETLQTVIIENTNENELRKGRIIAEEIIKARDMINTVMTPEEVAKHIRKEAEKYKLGSKIMGENEMKKLGMNAVLAVGRGSSNESQFAILVYKGNPRSDKKIVLVGKGVCFDAGGLGIKPAGGMETMREDKSGALTVTHTIITAARLGIKQNIVALMPLVENMLGGKAYKPGEIIKTMSGKTIEVRHTDAEGRIILSDALYYATLYKPTCIIDLATLTGSCISALGDQISGIMGNNQELINKIFTAGEKTGERTWQLPLYDEYDELIKGEYADYNNLKKAEGSNPAGAIQGAKLLEKFVGETPWCHMDIAGPSWSEEEGGIKPKGPTAYGIRLLTQLLLDL